MECLRHASVKITDFWSPVLRVRGGLLVSSPRPPARRMCRSSSIRSTNGLTVLLVPRPGDPNVAAGWIAKVGSVYERPGITGVAHLFEHMMFKGTQTIGTQNIEEDLQIIARLDELRAGIQSEQMRLEGAYELGQIDNPDDPASRTPAAPGVAVRVRGAPRPTERSADQGGLQPDLHRPGRLRHERRHELRLHDLLRQRSGQQARALVLDGERPTRQPGLS